jgi:hypothetical protein
MKPTKIKKAATTANAKPPKSRMVGTRFDYCRVSPIESSIPQLADLAMLYNFLHYDGQMVAPLTDGIRLTNDPASARPIIGLEELVVAMQRELDEVVERAPSSIRIARNPSLGTS